MQIDQHQGRLIVDGDPVPFVPSPNVGGRLEPRYAIVHYTAGPTVESALEHFADPENKVSAHLVIDRDGRVTQCVPLDREAWHAGLSAWDGHRGLNPISFGIELVNWGRLERRGADAVTWTGDPVPSDRWMRGLHPNEGRPAAWERYPTPQVTACRRILKALHLMHGLEDILGHDTVSPRRKWDPGPAFPLAAARSMALGRPIGPPRENIVESLRPTPLLVVHATEDDDASDPILAHADILVRRGYFDRVERRGIHRGVATDVAEVLVSAPIAVVSVTRDLLADVVVWDEIVAAGLRRTGLPPILLMRADEPGTGPEGEPFELDAPGAVRVIPASGPAINRVADPEIPLFEMSASLQELVIGLHTV